MPDLVTHYYFGREVINNLHKGIQTKIKLDIYDFASAGPDPFFFISFLNRKKNQEALDFGGIMHRSRTKTFFEKMIKITKDDNKMFSYLCGFITHYYLDTYAHPYIFHFTGEYKKDNKDTLVYRGLHTKLERAIDSYYIKKHYHPKPYKFKIHKEVLKLKKLDHRFKESFDKLYLDVYNHNYGFDYVNKSIKDQKRFYKFIYDRFGIKNKLFALLDNGKAGIDFKVLSYYGKEINSLDIFNEKHNMWFNPVDNTITSKDSFFDLFRNAKIKCEVAINAVFDYIFNDKNFNIDKYFANQSYITGLDCKDTRPLKYFNNIFK